MSENSIELANGAIGSFIKNNRFNTTCISFHYYLPLNIETIAADALLPYVLTSCSNEYKTFTELNLRLLELYGAELSCSVSKSGDFLHARITINVINDEFTDDNDSIILKASKFLTSIIFNPSICSCKFLKCDVEREKRKTIERIESEINNKRSFARSRLIEIMFEREPYGCFVYGKKEDVEKLSSEDLYLAWQRLVKNSFIQLNVIGKSVPSELFEEIKKILTSIKRENICDALSSIPIKKANTVTEVTETMDVTQGKLVLGFSSELYGDFKTALPLAIFTDIFGGGPYSKLFSNVREKQSLCYYCSASSRRSKGFILVDSGIESKNANVALNAILKELEDIKNGNVDEFTFNASKKSLIDSLNSYYDSASALDTWNTIELQGEDEISVEDATKYINEITLNDIINVANGIELHSIYKLLPKEA